MCLILKNPVQAEPGTRIGGFIVAACLLFFMTANIFVGPVFPANAESRPAFRCVIIVSQKIRPYMDAVQGIKTRLQEASEGALDIFFLELDTDNPWQRMTQTLEDVRFDVAIAVGPEATQYVWSIYPDKGVTKLFCMVLDPDEIIRSTNKRCGVTLNISAAVQLREFSRSLPSIKRIGLAYNPENNAKFAVAALDASGSMGFNLTLLKISRRSELLPVLRRQLKEIDALWVIPDRTVVSESLIPFIIKEAMANNVAVIGYNRFFFQSGAAISLVRDYEMIGRQTADMALRMVIEKQGCQTEAPYYQILVNTHVMRTLGLPAGPAEPASNGLESQ